MRCGAPFCKNTADDGDASAALKGISFHAFPSEVGLRAAWLRALGKQDSLLPDSAVVCSQHFLDDDICETESGLRQLATGAVPSTVQVCMICLNTDSRLFLMSKHKMEEAYEKLTGYPPCDVGNLKQALCIQCAQRLRTFSQFRDKSLRARAILMDLVEKHELITRQHIKMINRTKNQLDNNFLVTTLGPDPCDLYIQEHPSEEQQTDSEETLLTVEVKKERGYDSMSVDEDTAGVNDDSNTQYVKDEFVASNEEYLNETKDPLKYESALFQCAICYEEFDHEYVYMKHMSEHNQAGAGDGERAASPACEARTNASSSCPDTSLRARHGMYRGEKMVALATKTNKLLDGLENVILESNCEPNKGIQILEDVHLHYPKSIDFTPENSVDNANKNYYEINDNIDNISLTDLPNTLITDKTNTVCNDNTDENLIIIPSQILIESQENIYNNSDMHHQIFETICPQNPLQNMSNTPSLLISDNVMHSSATTIPLDTTQNILPNPPISHDSDTDLTDKKLVPYTDSDSDSHTEMKKLKKRRKHFEVSKKEWISVKNKQRREEGKTYFGREKKENSWTYNKLKDSRSIKSRCSCKVGKYSTLKCETIDENVRKDIFNHFWSLSWGEKKILVSEWITTIKTVRPRNRNTKETTKRANTFVYHLKVNDERLKVCRKMFLNTLDLGRWTVQNWKQQFSVQPPSTKRRSTKTSESSEVSEPK